MSSITLVASAAATVSTAVIPVVSVAPVTPVVSVGTLAVAAVAPSTAGVGGLMKFFHFRDLLERRREIDPAIEHLSYSVGGQHDVRLKRAALF